MVSEQNEADFRSFVRTGVVTPELSTEFRSYVRTPEPKHNLRTYAPLSEANTAASFVPQQWAATYAQRLISANGLLSAGATLKELTTGRKFLSYFSDDTASEAEILAENAQLNDAANPVNPLASVFSPTLNKYATSRVVSNQLLQDSAFDIDAYLAHLFAYRVARKANSFMTTDATTGLIPTLATLITDGGYGAVTAGAVPTLAELAEMQDTAQINSAYLESDSSPVYMVSPSLRTVLLKAVDTTGRRIFPEVGKGELLGFPLVQNFSMSFAAGQVGVVFGSIKRANRVTYQTLVASLWQDRFRSVGRD